jgi:hypothetical protein
MAALPLFLMRLSSQVIVCRGGFEERGVKAEGYDGDGLLFALVGLNFVPFVDL